MRTVVRNIFVNGRFLLAAAFCVASFLCQPTAYLRAQGQASFASLNGTVHDQSGALVPGATVTISNPEKNFSRTFTADTAGGYVFALIPPGTYTLKVTATGFQTYVQEGIVLAVAQTATQDIALTLGRMTEQITVTGATPLLNTSNANIGSEVTGRETVDLPLGMHNPMYLVSINSSVNQSSANLGSAAGIIDADATEFNFGGSFFGTTAYLLDGHWDSGFDWGGILYAPPMRRSRSSRSRPMLTQPSMD